jgi:hypothetical protein
VTWFELKFEFVALELERVLALVKRRQCMLVAVVRVPVAPLTFLRLS